MTPPARDVFAASTVFTISKLQSQKKYYLFFWGTGGGTLDVTVKVFGNGKLLKTTQRDGIDMRFTNTCPIFQFYP